jgi:(E)-4-hydroxy-3-methylbut-2-enyl-diphosphate synthase
LDKANAMSTGHWIQRRPTRQICVGGVPVGGSAPISVQSMTKTDTRDSDATVAQILDLEAAGCEIVRLAVPDEAAARALGKIRRHVHVPLIADIHFNYKLAILAVEAGLDGLRINPGNIGGSAKVQEVVRAARDRQVPIRVGVNAGSLEKELLARHGGATAAALVESAMRHVRMLEDAGHAAIKISVKASDVPRTVAAYRLLSRTTDYPLHLGVTEAGTRLAGTVRSCTALGILLAEGIGDTVRISLTDTPAQEVRVGLELLRSLGLRSPGVSIVSCPTCGRTEIDVASLAEKIEAGLEAYFRAHPAAPRPLVAVMGCVVNGPGEAREADIAIAGGRHKAALYVRGTHVATVDEAEIVEALMAQVRQWQAPPRPSRA